MIYFIKRAPQLYIWMIVLVLAVIFIFMQSSLDFNYLIPKRLNRLVAIVIGGICIAWSSTVFQSITSNRILTPAIMGYESVYLFFQSLLIFFMGTQSLVKISSNMNFALSILLMLGYSRLIHRFLFLHHKNDVYTLLMLGLVLTIIISTFTQFIQLKVSPGEFSILLGFSQASFGKSEPSQLLVSIIILIIVSLVGYQNLLKLDVLSLGRDQAISLGIHYQRTVRLYLVLIAILVAISTSLLGPTAFMGIFVANMAYELTRTFQHRVLLSMGAAIAIGVFILAQLAVEHLFNYRTTISILVNLVCGTWFLLLMLRVRGST